MQSLLRIVITIVNSTILSNQHVHCLNLDASGTLRRASFVTVFSIPRFNLWRMFYPMIVEVAIHIPPISLSSTHALTPS